MIKVLVVDDELLSAKALAKYLEGEGHQVETAISVSEAIELSKSFVPDILVADFNLGDELDGVQLARSLKRENSKLHSIICSGTNIDSSVLHSADTGIFKILEKPYSLEEVYAAIQQIHA